MPLKTESEKEGLEACESAFERDMMRRLLDGGYRVQPQVGALGFRIDMVVEGGDGRRLAVECDGDRFHGPEQWREDMRRQRVLERVGWRFWRCFASTFYRDTDRVVTDLFAMLSRLGIEPQQQGGSAQARGRYTEHRVVEAVAADTSGRQTGSAAAKQGPASQGGIPDGVGIDDKVVVLFGDDQKRLSLRLTENTHDLEKGLLSSATPFGKAVRGAEEGDEIEFEQKDGRRRKALIESVAHGNVANDRGAADGTQALTSAA
jgi:very-short-patch-repair endonuclease/transcription elongation GreA/GreB family factor